MKKLFLLSFIFTIFLAGCAADQDSKEQPQEIQQQETETISEVKEPVKVKRKETVAEEKPSILSAFDPDARSRDLVRVLHFNRIVTFLEAYNIENGLYPQNKGCIGSGEVFGDDPLMSIFQNNTAPKDPLDERGDIIADIGGCISQSRYYYEFVGDPKKAEYLLGTVMEVPFNNNIKGKSLDDIDYDEIQPNCPAGDCTFFILFK